jgi:16S rRNA G966 N2-methylase RsmD
LSQLGFQERALVIKVGAQEFLKKASSVQESFDIFFLDPPYQSEEIDRVLPIIGESKLLSEKGILIIEHFSKKKVPAEAGRLKIEKVYRYGDTVLTLYRRADA